MGEMGRQQLNLWFSSRKGDDWQAYIDHNKGGTAKARIQFQNQLLAVANETAFALIFVGKISEGYVQDVGPHVVAKVQTNK